MRDQYRVLSERYEQVYENESSVNDTYKSILDSIIEYSQPENKDKFLRVVKKYHSMIFRPGRGGVLVAPEFGHFIQKPLGPVDPTRKASLSERLYFALYWAGYILNKWSRHGKAGKEAKQSMRNSFDVAFNIWCEELKQYKAIQAAQTQHTATHGVDLRDL